MVADNRLTILGGRNLGNDYFGLNYPYNFLDLDVLGLGPAARLMSKIFDHFWNSKWVVPGYAYAYDVPQGLLQEMEQSRSTLAVTMGARLSCWSRSTGRKR